VNLTRLQQVGITVAIACILVAVAVGVYGRTRTPRTPSAAPVYTPPPGPAVPPTVVVQVAGAVVTPGLYTLPRGSRIQQAVEAAGGILSTADMQRVNLAAPVEDGERVDIPAAQPQPTSAAMPTGQASSPARQTPTVPPIVNVNTASLEELQLLPGIGPSLAEEIVRHRQRYGPFRAVDDLHAVPGIGPKRIEEIRPYARTQ
jgi:competence protein ComEA